MTGLRCLIDVRWLNVWNRCRVGPWRAERTFACIASCLLECEVCAWKCWLLAFDAPSCPVLPSEYTTIMLITDLYALMIFVGWLYETRVVLALDAQRVRLQCCVHLGVVIIGVRRTYETASCNLILMRHFAFRIHYNVTMAVHRSLLLEYMERLGAVLAGPGWSVRAFVLLRVINRIWRRYLSAFDAVWGLHAPFWRALVVFDEVVVLLRCHNFICMWCPKIHYNDNSSQLCVH